ncbi:MAG: ABC transporter ATP-binding protein/permease [Ruminococcus sp.]|nr:ABC transporter ATP-binding protein/permease [Ruminococcus sp.]
MLQLKNIVKQYTVGDTKIDALKGVSLDFRQSEFVSVLGQSGCGKTTLLNIIGGLDRYTSGDLIINGTSTKEYKDVDWDIYRNNSIGFVFQSYNLISHQTVLSNVELAMTLAGVSKEERRRRATEALEKVGLGDQLRKKPTQMSGGQMQRVAIARALVNNPSIILADEPTGALDSETSVQIMDILKDISKDRLIIMVTHNGDLAEKYSSRIVRLLDGKVTDDSNPYNADEDKKASEKSKKRKKKKSMSFATALSLSMNNLMTKKGRTFLTAFAGSIGIIGIALILSLSHGIQNYIDQMESDTLSTYPIQITNTTMDMTSMLQEMQGIQSEEEAERPLDKIYTNKVAAKMLQLFTASETKNDLKRFKDYIDSPSGDTLKEHTNDIEYQYNLNIQVYSADTADGVYKVNPNEALTQMMYGGMDPAMLGSYASMFNMSLWSQMLSNTELIQNQYDVVAGEWADDYNEIMLVVNDTNEISDMVLYSLGLLNEDNFTAIQKDMMTAEGLSKERIEEFEASERDDFTYDELLSTNFKLIFNTDYYEKNEQGIWVDKSRDEDFMKNLVNNAPDLKISGIIRPDENAATTSIAGAVAYNSSLRDFVIEHINASEIVKEQEADKDKDIFTGMAFDIGEKQLTMDDVKAYIATLPDGVREQAEAQIAQADQAIAAGMMTESDIVSQFQSMMMSSANTTATYDSNLTKLGVVDLSSPTGINIYPANYDSKEEVETFISDYNTAQETAGNDQYIIHYTDIMGLMMSSVTTIVNMVTYGLISFVSISLVVSSIMIGIITYISVLERTKEIGILRSIGASKRDVSRVFTAETIIEGFAAGAIGIGITILLCIPAEMILRALTNITGLVKLPIWGGVGLIIISMILTIIAGFFPSKMAAKKDPVEALRTE